MPNPLYRSFIPVLLSAGLAACGKGPAATEPPARAAATAGDAATQVGASTSSRAGTLLNAPGEYMRGMAGHIDKAEKAAELLGKSAEEGTGLE